MSTFAIYIQTLGCKLNQIESESIALSFVKMGFSLYDEAKHFSTSLLQKGNSSVVPFYTTSVQDVRLVVVNTCTVTGKAEQKARHLIRSLLKKFPNAFLLVTGCYAQVEPQTISSIDKRVFVVLGSLRGRITTLPQVLASKLSSFPKSATVIQNASLFNGEKKKTFVPFKRNEQNFLRPLISANFFKRAKTVFQEISNEALYEILSTWNVIFKSQEENILQEKTSPPHSASQNEARLPVTSFNTQDESVFDLTADSLFFHSRASLKIQEGCNNKCAYCRIRLARGPSVSLRAAEVVRRVVELEKRGWSEVVLTGVNLSQYSSENRDFADLLSLILNSTEKIIIRISSLYPQRVDDAFLNVIASPRIAPHFHLSIQSGSPKILKAMHRPYTAEQVFFAIENLKKVKEEPFLACDLITGFPGETEEDFNATLDLCQKANFAWIHAFPFSARPGTEAWNMKPKIPERISHARVAKLIEFAKAGRKRYIETWLQREVLAVIEDGDENFVTCMTQNYLHGILCDKDGEPLLKKNLQDSSIKIRSLQKVKILEAWNSETKIFQSAKDSQEEFSQVDVKVFAVSTSNG